jgi:hypothetical protein
MRELSAANKASRRPTNAAHARKLALAIYAAINEARRNVTDCERQFVAGPLAFNAKIPAGATPFRAVREDAVPPGPDPGQQMSEFVTQRPVNLIQSEVSKRRIDGNE